MKHCFPILFLFLIILSCAEDDVIVANDPTVEIRFINASKLKVLTDSLTVTDDSINVVSDSIKFLSDSLTILSDTISVLNDSIDNGREEYLETRDKLQEIQTSFTQSKEEIEGVSALLTTAKSDLNTLIGTINSGKLLVTSITNSDNGKALIFEDSASSYRLPVSMNADAANFIIQIVDEAYSLGLTYERGETVDEKRRVKVVVSNIAIVSSDFDSTSCISVNCENETPVKFYF